MVVALHMVDNPVDFEQAIVVQHTAADSPELAEQVESMAKVDWAEAMVVAPQPVAVAYRPLAALAGHTASHNILVAHPALVAAEAVVVLRFPRCSFTDFAIRCDISFYVLERCLSQFYHARILMGPDHSTIRAVRSEHHFPQRR